MREGRLGPGGTHPAVLVDGPESLHGNISDVAPPEEDFPCGGKRCKGSEEVKQVIELYIFNPRSIHGDTLHTGAAQNPPPPVSSSVNTVILLRSFSFSSDSRL